MKLAQLLVPLLLYSGAVRAEGTEFSVKTTNPKNLVQFVSNAPLEKIVGRTRDVSGKVTLDLSNLKSGAKGTIRVSLKELDTGLSLRNEHMRVNHLDTKSYPDAVFTVKDIFSADPTNISGGGTAAILVQGDLDLHGVRREYEILGSLTYAPATSTLNVRCQWPISLLDHQIPRPEFLFMRLSDTQEVTVELELSK